MLCVTLFSPLYASDIKKLPLVYSKKYNISLWGLENLHPFDSKKYEKIARYLSSYFHTPERELFYEPAHMVNDSELLKFHTPHYLESLNNPSVVARITDITFLEWLPSFIIQSVILNSMRYATAGTRLAAELAWQNKQYAINIGGGFHHANANDADGFCVFGDIQLAMLDIWNNKPDAKIMYIDLDAHQGNGVELGLESYIKETDPSKARLVVFDVYGENNYPGDNAARTFIQYNRPVMVGNNLAVSDNVYFQKIADLATIISQEKPDFIFYNAGTDVYEKDPLGRMKLTKEGIIHRDEMVFAAAKENNIPIVMTLSGGYAKESAQIIGESIANLLAKVWHIIPAPQQPSHGWFTSWFKKQ